MPLVSTNGEHLSVREFLQAQIVALTKLVDERDRLYKERADAGNVAIQAALAAQEKAVAAALLAAKESTNAAFAASEKAIVKAEDAQKDSNAKSNEFRGQLADQATTFMPRNESAVLISAVNEKIEALRADVAEIKETGAGIAGDKQSSHDSGLQNQWAIGISIGVILAVVQIALKLLVK